MSGYNKLIAYSERISIQDRYNQASGSSHKRIGHRLRRKLCRTFPRGHMRKKWEYMYRKLYDRKHELIFKKEGVI